MKQQKQTIKFNYGLNNKTDTMALDLPYAKLAKNVIVTDTGRYSNRMGYSKIGSGNFKDLYTHKENKNSYAVIDDGLYIIEQFSPLIKTKLCDLLDSNSVTFTQYASDTIVLSNKDYFLIKENNDLHNLNFSATSLFDVVAGSGSLPSGEYHVVTTYVDDYGRESGANFTSNVVLEENGSVVISNITQYGAFTNVYIKTPFSTTFNFAGYTTSSVYRCNTLEMGLEVDTLGLNGIQPDSYLCTLWNGSIYTCSYDSSSNQTMVYWSEPGLIHLFNLQANFFVISGKVEMLCPTPEVLLIGTSTAIYAYKETALKKIQHYGVIPGKNWVENTANLHNADVLIWTEKGLATAYPITLLTDEVVNLDNGAIANGSILEFNGTTSYVVSVLKGGEEYNKRS